MTSTTGTDEHPEVAEISALTEGVLSPTRTADLRDHLAECELCAEVRSSLDEIRGLLGTLPGPARMPEDIAGRIEAALAAEALLDSTRPSPGGSVSRETAPGPVGPVSRETPSVPRETDGRPAGRPRAATGPGRRPAAPGTARAGRGRRWPRVLLGGACAAAVLGVGSFFLQSGLGHNSDEETPDTRAGQSAPPSVTKKELAARVQHLLSTSFKNAESRGGSADNSPETMRAPGTTAPSCVQEGIGRTETALAARQESFAGEDTYLVVLPHPGNAGLIDAYVVAASCATASPSSPGKVLQAETLPRL
ncbi:hypothetical protein ACFP1Z_06185 [Streptomyces gamaensis]|uniref:Zinc-finger domain-containing protein n=1 Tax=Streptomyces gamaensis TaxID=1763542 RepID=A0ABW0YW65_9ACTN